MSPVLPREERDAIRARVEAATDGPWFREFGDVITSRPDPRAEPWQEEPLAERIVRRAEHRDLRDPQGVADAEFIAHARTDVPALLDALDAAEAKDIRRADAIRDALAELRRAEAERDAARAEVAVLRGRIEALHRPDDHGPGRCDKPDCITSCRECGDDWPCATIRALAADEGEPSDRHPEHYCHRCGGPNVPWWVPSPVWNAVMGYPDQAHDGIVCPCCFAELAEAKGAKGPWRVAPREWPRGVSLVHVDGRVWDATTERWVEHDQRHPEPSAAAPSETEEGR